MKNLASMKKQLLRRGVLEDNIAQVQVSELKNVKGFWENTILKLQENWIFTIKQLKEKFDEAGGEFTALTHLLTWIQQKQFNNYVKENPDVFK